MARRTVRLQLVQRLVSPLATRIKRRIPRTRRRFPSVPPRWSLARRLRDRRAETSAGKVM
jgi:hypothetical protein